MQRDLTPHELLMSLADRLALSPDMGGAGLLISGNPAAGYTVRAAHVADIPVHMVGTESEPFVTPAAALAHALGEIKKVTAGRQESARKRAPMRIKV